MKKTFLNSAVLFMFCAVLALNPGIAQSKMIKLDLKDLKVVLAAGNLNDSYLFGTAILAKHSDVHVKALKDFKKTFKGVSNEQWYTISNGFLAEFSDHAVKNLVVYDRKGNWKFNICYYDEKKLPSDVRALVKSTYYDYAITRVEEIHVDEKVIYLVHLEDETTWKNVRVCEGEMQLMEDFKKQ